MDTTPADLPPASLVYCSGPTLHLAAAVAQLGIIAVYTKSGSILYHCPVATAK